ncbi:MAG TPA: cytochrome C, partial [Campylobacterales bacterium]|nr:cytochrome C [Campylobacterales bacterium]
MRSIFYIFFLSTFLFAQSRFDSFYVHQLESKTDPKELYVKYCASCHHEKRVGISAPPLLPIFLKKINDKRLFDIIKNSLPQTLMPKFDFLSDDEIFAIIKYLRSPEKDISWNLEDIKNSYQIVDKKEKRLNIKNHEDITLVVERGANRVWIMENKEILDWFNFNNVHGGLKFTLDGKNFYVPTRDGWIGHYSLKEGRLKDKIRACINLRNISLSRDGKKIFATCLMPQAVVIFDSLTLKPLKKIDLDGKISALYELYSKDEAIFTFRDKSNLVKIDTNSLELKYFDLKEPIEDFFIDPFEEFIIGTTRNGKRLSVYDIDRLQKVFEAKIEGMPHLFSATYWYKDGEFYFATPHLRKPYVTIWQMYNWKLIKKVNIGGDGFFVKTHPSSAFLWADNGSDELILIDKEDYTIAKKIPIKNKRYIHTEFSSNGELAYLSIYESDG